MVYDGEVLYQVSYSSSNASEDQTYTENPHISYEGVFIFMKDFRLQLARSNGTDSYVI
jgi:hypothetical protein